MYYNNVLNNIKESSQPLEIYLDCKCIVSLCVEDSENNTHLNVSIPSINVISTNINASGKYFYDNNKLLWVLNNTYKATYNYGVLKVVDNESNTITSQLSSIDVVCVNNSSASGEYILINKIFQKNKNGVSYKLCRNKKIQNVYASGWYYFVDKTNSYIHNDEYKATYVNNKWVVETLKNNSMNVDLFSVTIHKNIKTYNNVISSQSNVVIRNCIYDHARLFDYNMDFINEELTTSTIKDNLNLIISSNLNMHNNVILNPTRRKKFKHNTIDSFYVNEYKDNQWNEVQYDASGVVLSNEELLDQYTRVNGQSVNDYLLCLVNTVNSSLISNNNLIYLYSDNVYNKVENTSNDFYNLPNNIINGELTTGGVWYKAYDKFFTKTLVQQLNTYAEYSKLLLNNGNLPYWDVGDNKGLFYESGVIIFECGYGETINNYTNRVVSFIKSLPTNLNGCEVTFVFKTYGDLETIRFTSTIYINDFYNGILRIVGIAQNKTVIKSDDVLKPVVSFSNVDNVYIDNICFDYNFNENENNIITASCGTLEFHNVCNVKILSSEIKNIYLPTSNITSNNNINSYGILLNNSNLSVDGVVFKKCTSVIKAINNSKFNVDNIVLDCDVIKRDDVNTYNFSEYYNKYFKYLVEMHNNSVGYINCLRYVIGTSKSFMWNQQNNATSAVSIDVGCVFNHTHVGLNPTYVESDNGSVITELKTQTAMNTFTGGTKRNSGGIGGSELRYLNNFRYFESTFNNPSKHYYLNNNTLDNLHFYKSVDFKNSQIPIGDIVEWISVNTYSNSVDLWESEVNQWPWGFYPCYYKFYPNILRNGNMSINIPINGYNKNDYFYNVPLAIKMGYLINNKDSEFIKNYFSIPNFEPTDVTTSGIYYIRKIKLIKYSENVEYR